MKKPRKESLTQQVLRDWRGSWYRILQSQYGLALLLALLFLAALIFWHFSSRANLAGLALAGLVGAAALVQWPIIGAFYISFSIFGRLASIVPSIDTAIVLATLLVFFARKLLSWDLTWRFPAALRWIALLLAWLTTSIIWAADTQLALKVLVEYLKSFLVFLLILETAQSYRRIIYLILAAMGGALFAVLISTYTGFRFFFSGAAADLSRYVTVETTRLYGLWFDPNYFALALLTLIGVALALWRTRITLSMRLFAAFGFTAVILGIVISLSRAALLTVLVALFACLRAERRRLRLLLLVGSVIGLVLLFLPLGLAERLETFTSATGDASLQSRGRLLRGGIEMAIDAFPFGVGLGNYYYHSLSYTNMKRRMLSHNSYIDLAAEGGILALFFFGGFIVSLFQATGAKRHRFEATELADNLAIGFRISLIAFLLGATFLSAAVFVPLWWLAGLIAAKASCDHESAENEICTLAPLR